MTLIETLTAAANQTVPGVTNTSDLFNLFIFTIQWSAIILSALAALVTARKRGLDMFGALVIVFIVSNGGGTLRDMVLGRYPIFWIKQPVYALTPIVVGLISFWFVRRATKSQRIADKIVSPVKKVVDDQTPTYLLIDTLALGLWVYLGTYFAITTGVPPLIAPIMGVMTAAFGGVLRDMFFAQVPQAFMPGQVSVSAALVGAVAYAAIYATTLSNTIGFFVCFILTFMVRFAAIKFNWQTH